MKMRGLLIYRHIALLIGVGVLLSGCAAVAIGGGSAVALLASREKGFKGAASDTSLSTKIKMKLYKFNPDLHAKVTVNVQNGEVLLVGIVKDPSWKMEAERLALEVEGVQNVINNIETEGEEDIGTLSNDGWITTRVKSALMFADDVYSLNYSVKTINGVVYMMGVAQDQTEREKVLGIASNVGGVTRVINHIRLKGEQPIAAGEFDTSQTKGENSKNTSADSITVTELPPQPGIEEDKAQQ